MTLPLKGITVLDFSQFLAGPLASLRLADLGARVIKIEKPDTGDLCRSIYISELELDGDSTLFHSINRNKESYAANLKDPDDLAKVKQLLTQVDVMINNFRPGVIQRIGLDYSTVKSLNPKIVYAEITGYGTEGPWRDLPGQDLLAQAKSGLTWLTGKADDPPRSMGLAVADMLAGHGLVQGILACLVRRGITGKGGKIETSLLEAMLDFQFEVLTTHLNDGGKLPNRAQVGSGHAYLGSPYGIYQTSNGHLALAMMPLDKLGSLIDLQTLTLPEIQQREFSHRNEINQMIADHLITQTTQHWLDILEPADIWCAEIMNWEELLQHEAFEVLKMTQKIVRPGSRDEIETLRCPLRIDGKRLTSPVGAPSVGQDNEKIEQEMLPREMVQLDIANALCKSQSLHSESTK